VSYTAAIKHRPTAVLLSCDNKQLYYWKYSNHTRLRLETERAGSQNKKGTYKQEKASDKVNKHTNNLYSTKIYNVF